MSALSHRKVPFMARPTSASFPAKTSPWTVEDSAASGARARDLQTRLKADVYAGGLENDRIPAPHAPARGMIIAAVPTALLWWGIISAVGALAHHVR